MKRALLLAIVLVGCGQPSKSIIGAWGTKERPTMVFSEDGTGRWLGRDSGEFTWAIADGVLTVKGLRYGFSGRVTILENGERLSIASATEGATEYIRYDANQALEHDANQKATIAEREAELSKANRDALTQNPPPPGGD